MSTKCLNFSNPEVLEVLDKYGKTQTVFLWVDNNYNHLNLATADALYAEMIKKSPEELPKELFTKASNALIQSFLGDAVPLDDSLTDDQARTKILLNALDQKNTNLTTLPYVLSAYNTRFNTAHTLDENNNIIENWKAYDVLKDTVKSKSFKVLNSGDKAILIKSFITNFLRDLVDKKVDLNDNIFKEFKDLFKSKYREYLNQMKESIANPRLKKEVISARKLFIQYLVNNETEFRNEVAKYLSMMLYIDINTAEDVFAKEEVDKENKDLTLREYGTISLEERASSIIKLIMASIPDVGSDKNNRFQVTTNINFNLLLNKISNALSKVSPDIDLFLGKLNTMALTDNSVKIFLSRIEPFLFKDGNLNNFNIINALFKIGDLQKRNLSHFIITENQDLLSVNSFDNSLEAKFLSDYATHYYTKYVSSEITENFIKEIAKVLKTQKQLGSEKNVFLIYDTFGIKLSPKTNLSEKIKVGDNNYLTYEEIITRIIEREYSLKNFQEAQAIDSLLPFMFERNKTNPIKTYLNAIIQDQMKYVSDDISLSYINANGDLEYALTLNTSLSLFAKGVNTINTLYANNDTLRREFLEKEYPELFLPQYVNSKWKQLIVEQGAQLIIEENKELTTANANFSSVDLSLIGSLTRIRTRYDNILNNKIPLLRAADRSLNNTFKFVLNGVTLNLNTINEADFVNKMVDHFYYELQTAAIYRELNQEGISLMFGENYKDLRIFKEIIKNPELITLVNEALEAQDKGFVFNKEQQSLLENDIRTWFREEALATEMMALKSLGALQTYKLNDKEYYYLFNTLSQDEEGFNINKEIERTLMTHIIQSIEITYFITGDVAQYKTKDNNKLLDFPKRIKFYNSPKETLNISDRILAWADAYFPNKYKSNRKVFNYYLVNDALTTPEEDDKTVSFVDDILKKGFELMGLSEEGATKYSKKQSKKFKSINKADGFGVISFPSYRDILLFAKKWSPEMEEDYNVIMEGKVPMPKNGRPVSTYPILKTFGVGSVQEILDKLNIKNGIKHAIMPLNPLVIKDSIFVDIHNYLLENQVDMIQFASSVKTGGLIFNNKVENFPTNIEELNNLKEIQTIQAKDFGLQVATEDKPINLVTVGKQIRTMILSNLYEDGYVQDESTYTSISEYLDAQEGLTNYLVEQSFKKIGFSFSSTGELEVSEDNRAKLVEFLKDVVKTGDSNTEKEINSLLKEDVYIDFLQNPAKIMNKLLTLFRDSTVNQKTSGVMAILAPFEGLRHSRGGKVDKNLLWYTTSKRTQETLPTEMYLKIPNAFKKLLREKYNNNLDALNKDVEETNNMFRKYHNNENVDLNKTPIKIELLTILGYRIPTQAYSSIEYIIIKKFLSETSGDTVVASHEIVAKTDSDFDVDKLTMYLSKFEWDKEKGFTIYRGESNINFQYFIESLEKEYNKIDKRIERKYLKNEIEIWKKEYTPEFIEDLITETIKSLNSEEARNINEEKSIERAKVYLKKKEELEDKLNKNRLYNNLLFSQLNLLKIPSQLSLLLNPVTTDTLKSVSDDINDTRKKDSQDVPFWKMFLPTYNSFLEDSFLIGKKLIGVVSNHIRSHVVSQMVGLYVQDPFSKIFFPTNKMGVVAPKYVTKITKDEKGNNIETRVQEGTEVVQKISLGGKTSSNKDYPILSLLSEFLSAYVDIAKEPFVFNLNAKNDVIPTILYLLRAGVDPRLVAYFVTQESVIRYTRLKNFNDSEPVVVTNNSLEDSDFTLKQINYWREKAGLNVYTGQIYAKERPLYSLYQFHINYDGFRGTEKLSQELDLIQKDIDNGSLNFTELNFDYLLSSTNPKDGYYYKHQEMALQLFLYYKVQASFLNNLATTFKDDTYELNSLDELRSLHEQQTALLRGKFFAQSNIIDYANNPILKSFSQANNKVLKSLSTLLITDFNPMIKSFLNDLKDTIYSWDKNNSFEKISRIVNSRFVDFMIQNYYSKVYPQDPIPINEKGAKILLGKNTDKNIPDTIANIKADVSHPLHNNLLINNLNITRVREKQDNVTVFNYKNSDSTSQSLIDAFNEVYATDPELAKNLIKVNLLQSGKLFSKISSLNLMDTAIYLDMILPVLNYATSKLDEVTINDLSNFEILLKQSHKELLPIAKKINLKSGKKILKLEYNEREKQAIAGGFKRRIPVKGKISEALNKRLFIVEKNINIITSRQEPLNPAQEKQLIKLETEKAELNARLKNSYTKYYKYQMVPLYWKEVNKKGINIYEVDFNAIEDDPSDEGFRVNMDASTIEYVAPVINNTLLDSNNNTISKTSNSDNSTSIESETKINIYSSDKNGFEDLSNFAERPIKIGNETFRTPEGAYQAMKIWFTNAVLLGAPASKENLEILKKLKTASGKEAKTLGGEITDLSEGTWDINSSNVMKNILTLSFQQNSKALDKLLSTGNATLTHTQDKTKWKTEFPKLLMEVRNELRTTQPSTQVQTTTQSSTNVNIAKINENIKKLNSLKLFMINHKESKVLEVGDTIEVYFDKSDSTSILTISSIKKINDMFKIELSNSSGKTYTYTVDRLGKGTTIEVEPDNKLLVFEKDLAAFNTASTEFKKLKEINQPFIQGKIPAPIISNLEKYTINRNVDGVVGDKIEDEGYKLTFDGHPDAIFYLKVDRLENNEPRGWLIENVNTGLRASNIGDTAEEAYKDFMTKLTRAFENVKISDEKNIKLINSAGFDIEKLKASTSIKSTVEELNKSTVKELNKDNSIKVISDADVAAYNSYIAKSNNKAPEEFFTSKTTFKEFYNPVTGKREKAPGSSKWLLQDNGLYNLVDKDSGEVYITGVDLKTGLKAVSEDPLINTLIEMKKINKNQINQALILIKGFRENGLTDDQIIEDFEC